MGLRYFTLIAAMLFATNAFAIIIPRVSVKAPARECEDTPFQSNVNDLSNIPLDGLVHNVAVAANDARVALNKFKPKVLPPLKKEEKALISKIIGRCQCDFQADDGSMSGDIHSACFIAGTRQTNTELHFNAHFVRPLFTSAGSPKAGKLNCSFTNKAGDEPVAFSFVPGSFRVGSLVEGDEPNDRAVVKLAHAIPKAVELPIVDGASVIREDMPLYFFSTEQERMKVPVAANQPIAEEVRVLKVYRDELTGKILGFSTTGSSTMHTSGSVYAMRDPRTGGLVAVGMMYGGSNENRDGEPVYKTDPTTGKVLLGADGKPRLHNVTMAIPMKSDFTAEDKQMADGSGSNPMLPSATTGL